MIDLFRTHQEMRKVYFALEKKKDRGRPYCITLHRPERYFGFIGMSHTNDPNDPSWKRYFEEWDKFIASTNPDKIVFHEGNSRPAQAETREEAIRDGNDSGVTAWLAQGAGIPFISPEPDFKEQIPELRKCFTEAEIMIYYIGRQLHQYLRYDYLKYPDRNAYIQRTLDRYYDVYDEWGVHFSVADITRLIEEKLGKSLDDAGKKELLTIDDPAQNPVSSLCSHIRDRSVFTAVESAWREGKDVFCVYGSGHAIVMEPALRKLIEA